MALTRATILFFLTTYFSHYLLQQYSVSAWSLKRPIQNIFRRIRRRDTPTVSFPSNTSTSDIHDYFMDLALDQAHKAQQRNEVPIGALVVRPISTHCFQVLGRAYNQVEYRHDASAHAELLAMKQASRRIQNWRLYNTTLYSTLEPCPMCLAASQGFRVEQIVYGAPDLRLGAIETHVKLLDVPHPFHNISRIVKNVKKQSSVDLLQGFFRRRRQEQAKRRKKKEQQRYR